MVFMMVYFTVSRGDLQISSGTRTRPSYSRHKTQKRDTKKEQHTFQEFKSQRHSPWTKECIAITKQSNGSGVNVHTSNTNYTIQIPYHAVQSRWDIKVYWVKVRGSRCNHKANTMMHHREGHTNRIIAQKTKSSKSQLY